MMGDLKEVFALDGVNTCEGLQEKNINKYLKRGIKNGKY